MHQFDEKISKLEGFSAFYEREILPALTDTDIKRQVAVRSVFRTGGVIAAATLVVAIMLWQTVNDKALIFFAIFGGFAGIAGFTGYKLKNVQAETKNILVSNICEFVGWQFSETVLEKPPLELLQDNGLLPKRYTRVNFEDKMSGEVHQAHFEALECHMEQKVKTKNGHRWETVFRGALMAIDFHREFLGKTVVLRDAGIFNRKKRGDMKRVGLVDPVFEKIFEAYGTDQVEARYLLTPDFMQQLVDLEKSVDGKKIRFAFLNDLLLIVVETPNRFEAGSMFKSLTDFDRTQKILDEITAVYNIVDVLMKRPMDRLRG